ncbi:DNA-binding NarL/FixJ family response regulator [Kitasatospora gansuensis]|uniref:DNA-binding NarL/FixJ family response regulator n=1 Tax=Kitasatospora gansuensis TaxID=258050 RepID=A0A7W7SJT2_9ACTN|nr:response regulator transcription factor [Kitasatospora gansuensis]MBB4951427.1 DNA-binding NarL/FixJ family response regulator [Kitasatospora gansuensis]
MTIRVLLADDQALLAGTFRLLIESCEDMEVVGVAGDGRAAVELARTTRPDVVVMDIRMPVLDGLAATEEICRDPALVDTRVLILTTFEIDEYVARALRAGASGFLGKGVGPEELLGGIRTVAAGDTLLSPTATRALVTRFLAHPETDPATPPPALDVLTAREREVMVQVAEGLSNDEIAERMFVSPLTVRTHVQRTMTKLGARHRAQLVAIAYQSGLVRVDPPR